MMDLESKGAYDNLHVLCPVFTPITLVVWLVCDTHYTVYSFVYIYMHVQGISLIQDWLAVMTFKTQFSGTTSSISRKLIHSSKGSV